MLTVKIQLPPTCTPERQQEIYQRINAIEPGLTNEVAIARVSSILQEYGVIDALKLEVLPD